MSGLSEPETIQKNLIEQRVRALPGTVFSQNEAFILQNQHLMEEQLLALARWLQALGVRVSEIDHKPAWAESNPTLRGTPDDAPRRPE